MNKKEKRKKRLKKFKEQHRLANKQNNKPSISFLNNDIRTKNLFKERYYRLMATTLSSVRRCRKI